jgi:hypothetical protein
MAGEPVSAYQEKLSQRMTRWIKRHQVWSQIIALAVTVGIVALATWGIASRQNQLAEKQILFDELRGYDREIQVQLKTTAEELAKDVQFMSLLPPIQGIIDARNGAEENEGEDVWRGRLEMIYEGLLSANPDYLAITYSAMEGDEQGANLVRVERHLSDAVRVRKVPKSRLGTYADAELLMQTAASSPGDILLLIRGQQSTEAGRRQEIRLIATTPVYDEATGNLFGMVSIETNLLNRIVHFLDRVEQQTANIHITDAQGEIWVSDDPLTGVDITAREINVAELIPETAAFFEDETQKRQLNPEHGWIAGRVMLDPANRQINVGVVLELAGLE